MHTLRRVMKLLIVLAMVAVVARAQAQDQLRVVMHSFIPSSYPASEKEILPLPGTNKKMILADFPIFSPDLPVLGKQCFGTDDRLFSNDPNASARVTADFVVDVSPSPKIETDVAKRFRSGTTRKIACTTGTVLATKNASVSSCVLGAPAYADGKLQVYVSCKASDPLVPLVPEKFTPDLHFGGVFTFDSASKSISFKGDVGAFPSYEAYASLNGSPLTKVFAVAPEKGAGGQSLIDLWQHVNTKTIDVKGVKLATVGAPAERPGALEAGGGGRVFHDDFETGKVDRWAPDPGGRNKCIVVSSSSDGKSGPHGDSRMLRCNWDATVAWNDPRSFESLVLNSWPYSKQFLIRFWIRVDANVGVAQLGPKFLRLGANLSSYGEIQEDGKLFFNFGGDAGQIGVFWGGGSGIRDGRWHEIEIYVKRDSASGVVRLWQDGSKLWDAPTKNTQNQWTPFTLNSAWNDADHSARDATNYVYWDDFEIYSDAGTGAQGSMADASIISTGSSTATSPPAPSGLSTTSQ